MQSKRQSLMEILVNLGVGFFISCVVQAVIFHYKGLEVSILDNMEITMWFTLVSLIRGYCIRRWFNRRLNAQTE